MKILQVHNYYRSSQPSGENIVVDQEREMLRKHGHDVHLLSRHSDVLTEKGMMGTLIGGLLTPWNSAVKREIKQVMSDFSPQIVHVHNTFPLISPSVFHYVGNQAKKVLTLHNYRIVCPASIPMRNDKICTLCIDSHSVWPSIQHKCYRQSRLATLPLAISGSLHRTWTWHHQVDAFLVFTHFQRELMSQAGIPVEKIHIKPNGSFEPVIPIPWIERDLDVIFVGRLSQEKGLKTLLQAWEILGALAPCLTIVGDGPLRSELEERSANLNVHFTGNLDPNAARSHIARSKLLVLPSHCFEGFPMAILEAYASATAVVSSGIGSLTEIVQENNCGVCFSTGDSTALARTLTELWQQPQRLECLGKQAKHVFEDKYSEQAIYSRLLDIYTDVLAVS